MTGGLGPEGTTMQGTASRPILVTGATGFLGSHVLAAFDSEGAPVVGVGSAQTDLTKAEAAYGLVEEVRPERREPNSQIGSTNS